MLPLQPIYTDSSGVIRFQANKVVNYLLKHGGLDLNKLAVASELSDCKEDWEQFAQLIGYSISGFGELSYVSDQTYNSANIVAESGISAEAARIAYLEGQLKLVHGWFKSIVPELFRIHPDDLET